MMIAPRSSKIARVNKKTFSELGARDPTKANTPKAKAMSVAAGIAQPLIVSGVFQLNIRYSAAGIAMPPTAAKPGKTTSAGFFSFPSNTSRFNSSPTRKKKIAIRPSLIHKIIGFDKPSPLISTENCADKTLS